MQFLCLGCFGRAKNYGSVASWPHGLSEGRRELFKVHVQPSLSGVPELGFSSLLLHWQVSSLVWFSLEAFLGIQLPRETPVTGMTQAGRPPRSEDSAQALVSLPHTPAAQTGLEGAVRWEGRKQHSQVIQNTERIVWGL